MTSYYTMKILFITGIKNAARGARGETRKTVELIKPEIIRRVYTFNYSITLARINLLKVRTRHLTFVKTIAIKIKTSERAI
jgi:hypothetical protein